MHELSVCEALLDRVRATAREHGARSVGRITVRLGPLSGVEPDLLDRAFGIARAGDYTADARLVLESAPVRVRCRSCGNEAETASNRLVCAACGDYHVDLVGGDELLLASIELHGVSGDGQRTDAGTENETGEVDHV